MSDWKWYPQFTGLIKDPEGKHYNKMGMSIWLFNFFCADADREKGEWSGPLGKVAEQTGIPIWTIKRYMRVLKKGGYIDARRGSNGLVVKIKKYKTLIMQEQKKAPTIDEISADERTPLEKNSRSKLYIAGLEELQEYFRGIMGRAHLGNLDTYMILQMYWDKIPLVVIKNTVDEVKSKSKKKEIFTIRYFKKAIYENHKKYTHRLEPEKELMTKEDSDKKKEFHSLAEGVAKERTYGAEEEII